MEITYDFNPIILDAIAVLMFSHEIPFIKEYNSDFRHSLWFLAICEEKKKVWCISISQPSTTDYLELSAAEYDFRILVPFRKYLLEKDNVVGLHLCRFIQEELEISHKRTVKDFHEFDEQINGFFKELEQASDAEIEILDLRNVEFWSYCAEEESNDFDIDPFYNMYASRYGDENDEENFPF